MKPPHMRVDQVGENITIGMEVEAGRLEIVATPGEALRFGVHVLNAAGAAFHFREYGAPREQK